MDKTQKEEYLERLWHMAESGEDNVEQIGDILGDGFEMQILRKLQAEAWLALTDEEKKIALTEKGKGEARRLVRAHRLAERLLCDVLGCREETMETSACEFEHLVAPELVDSICTLLGHPMQCPHGRPIPRGKCCEETLTSAESPVRALTQLKPGDSGRIAYVCCDREEQMHRLSALSVRPGLNLTVHQTYPAYVIECEGGQVALEDDVAANIYVWVDRETVEAVVAASAAAPPRRRFRNRKGRPPNRE